MLSDGEVAELLEQSAATLSSDEGHQRSQDREAPSELTEHEVARLLKLSVPAPINLLESTADRIDLEKRFITDSATAARPDMLKPHGHLGVLSTKSREQLLDALGRCYIEAALADLLSELERKDSDLQPVSGSQGNTSAPVAPQTERAHEAARR
jgi:hypothetical protein